MKTKLLFEKLLRNLALVVYGQVQLYPTLCDLMDCSPLDSSVHGIFQARILEWVAFSLLQGNLPNPGIDSGTKPASPVSPEMAGRFFTTETSGNLLASAITHLKPEVASKKPE